MQDISETFSTMSLKKKKRILSIDIGVHNLALVESEDSTILFIDLVDITIFAHKTVPEDECQLYHAKTFFDWVQHVVQEYTYLFERVDVILIERQPPGGFTVIEQLLFGFYRNKAVLISPNSVHAFHSFQKLDYEQRKVAAMIVALPYLTIEQREHLNTFDRQHDVADAITQLLYYLHKTEDDEKMEKKEEIIDMVVETEVIKGTSIPMSSLDKYIYIPKK